jgi:hypothetical protein
MQGSQVTYSLTYLILLVFALPSSSAFAEGKGPQIPLRLLFRLHSLGFT